MKFVFFGTPDYVIPVIDALQREFKSKTGESPITAVVTQAPKPTGRQKKLTYSPVDTWAHKRNIPKYFDLNDVINNNIRADVGILASYGKIIPPQVITWFPHGILNIHPSILPSWRGASPVQATIISESRAGASIIELDEKLDHGGIVSQFKDEVLAEDTTQTLRNRLFARSAEVLTTLIPPYLSGKVTPRKQGESTATFTREIKKSDGFIPPKYVNAALQGLALKDEWKIDFIKDYKVTPSAEVIERFIRAMQPWPVTWTTIKIKDQELRIKILKSHLEQNTKYKIPNTNQKLVIDSVQLEGKSPVTWKQFQEGYPTAIFE